MILSLSHYAVFCISLLIRCKSFSLSNNSLISSFSRFILPPKQPITTGVTHFISVPSLSQLITKLLVFSYLLSFSILIKLIRIAMSINRISFFMLSSSVKSGLLALLLVLIRFFRSQYSFFPLFSITIFFLPFLSIPLRSCW